MSTDATLVNDDLHADSTPSRATMAHRPARPVHMLLACDLVPVCEARAFSTAIIQRAYAGIGFLVQSAALRALNAHLRRPNVIRPSVPGVPAFLGAKPPATAEHVRFAIE